MEARLILFALFITIPFHKSLNGYVGRGKQKLEGVDRRKASQRPVRHEETKGGLAMKKIDSCRNHPLGPLPNTPSDGANSSDAPFTDEESDIPQCVCHCG
jgi:hypothetical protein